MRGDTDTTAAEGLEPIRLRKWSSFEDEITIKLTRGPDGIPDIMAIEEAVSGFVRGIERRAPTPPGRGEDERAIGELIDQRDAAERALSNAYSLVIGKTPEWSNVFGYRDALNEIEEAMTPPAPSPGAVTREQLASDIIEDVVADIRDRRWLKWLFGPPGSCDLVQPGVERLNDETQLAIYADWRALVLSRLQYAREGEKPFEARDHQASEWIASELEREMGGTVEGWMPAAQLAVERARHAYAVTSPRPGEEERLRTGRTVYLAARYSRHPEMREVRSALETMGYVVTSRWINGGHELTKEGSTEAHEAERVRYAQEDAADLRAADICLSFSEEPRKTTTRGGRHVEHGMALALGKRTMVVGHRENVFHCLPKVEFYATTADALAALRPTAQDEADPSSPPRAPARPS